MANEWQKLLGDGVRAELYEEWMTQTMQSSFSPEEIAAMGPEERARVESRMRIGKVIIAAAIETSRSEQALGMNESDTYFDILEMMSVAMATLLQLVFKKNGHNEVMSHTIQHFNNSLIANFQMMKKKK